MKHASELTCYVRCALALYLTNSSEQCSLLFPFLNYDCI